MSLDQLSRRGFLSVAGLAAVTTTLPHRAAHPDVVPADIERWMRLANVPGLALAEVHGVRVEARGWGVRKAGESSVVDGDTVFEAASLTKQLFAYLVHRLAMDGTLDLDRPVSEYLALPNADDARARTITPRLLLGHASGWRNWRGDTTQKLVADFDPGSKWNYSGEGYFFLQRIVEARTGQPVARLLRERVFVPLGMTRTSLLWTPALDPYMTSPHNGRGVAFDSWHVKMARAARATLEKQGKSPDDWTTADAESWWTTLPSTDNALPSNLLPNVAASLLTTARDHGRFLAHLLSDPAGREVLGRMTTPVVRINEALSWGAGVGLEQESNQTMFWQWGDNNGFKHFLLGDPSSRSAWVVFTNGNAGRSVYERVLRAGTGRDHAAFLWI